MPPLRVEYAKSGRSRCCLKECNKMIEKGEVRVGTGVMMPGMDEPSYKWRHVCCFTARQAKNAGGSVDSVEGLEDLAEGDQQLVVKMMKGELVGDSSLLGKTGTAGTAVAAVSPKKAKKAATVVAGEGGAAKKKARVEVGKVVDGYASDATDDYDVEEAGTSTVVAVKPLCPYGAGCFRKNPAHFAEYRHGDEPIVAPTAKTTEIVTVVAKKREPSATPVVQAPLATPLPVAVPIVKPTLVPGSGEKKCPHGALCFRTDPQHHADFLH